MTAGMFLSLCEPGLDKVWHDEGTPRPLQYQSVFNVSSFDKLFIEEAKMAGFGPLQPQDEGEGVVYDEAIAPITKRWDYDVYALGYQVTDKLVRNEQYSQVEKLEMDLRRSADDTTETYAMAILNNATSTSIATGFDGPPFTYTPRRIIVAPDLMLTAEELISSPNKPQFDATATTADTRNAVNIVGRNGLQIVVLDYLTSTTFWAAQAEKHDLRFAWRFKSEIENKVDFETNSVKRKVRQGMLRGFGEWRGFYLGKS
jgi:hypothetical protein